jgi:hypothetical protein
MITVSVLVLLWTFYPALSAGEVVQLFALHRSAARQVAF